MRHAARLCLACVLMALTATVVVASPAAADNCSGPSDCERTGGYNGIIGVVGGGAAVAAAAAAAAAAGAGADGIEGTDDDEEVDLAIVQVDVDRVEVGPGRPAQVIVTGWHTGPSGTQRMPSLPLTASVNPGAGILLSPLQAVGDMVLRIELDEHLGVDQTIVTVTGTYKGTTTVDITVDIVGEYRAEVF